MKLSSQEYADLLARHPNLAPKGSGGVFIGPEGLGGYKVTLRPIGAIAGQKHATQGLPKPPLNKTETRYRNKLAAEGIECMDQAITLRLEPPFKSYRADLAYVDSRGGLVLVEVKAPHRFREKGIAKAAVASKTYPMFRFELALYENKTWKISVLSP